MRGLVVGIVLFFLSVQLPVATAETPGHGACDSTGKLACAGADVGGTVTCATDAQGAASCGYAFGWLMSAFSPAALPGSGAHVVDWSVGACSSIHGCALLASAHDERACGYAATTSCDFSDAGPPGTWRATLAMGECVTLTVTVHAHVEARTGAQGPAGPPIQLANATFEREGVVAGQTCLVDDGR